jgi:esterase/lipase superfamily enzyme
MTLFLDVRTWPVGGDLANTVATNSGTSLANYSGIKLTDLTAAIRGKNVLIGIHGFRVNREAGIQSFSNWEALLDLPQPAIFIGLLWPGDSVWLQGLDYPEEPHVANDTGQLIAPFLDANFGSAASISFVSHSLGARVLLATVSKMNRRTRRVTIMAGAIDHNCFDSEFQTAATQIDQITALSSRVDKVLTLAFPLGNFVGGILAAGHPWAESALGLGGPSTPWPANFAAPFELPDGWGYDHGDYLGWGGPAIAPPVVINGPAPANKGAWTAAYVSTHFK